MSRGIVRSRSRAWRGKVEVQGRRPQRARPALTVLEDRRLMTTFSVTSATGTGPGTLPYEIGQANADPGDNTIDFSGSAFSTATTIDLGGNPLVLSDSGGTESIVGPSAGLTICGDGSSGVFQVDPNVTATISGLTIAGGSASGLGGGLANYGTVTLTDCMLTGNQAAGGGAVYAGGPTTLDGCTITGNSATGDGGGVYALFSNITLNNCTVSGNSAARGGGLYNFVGSATLTDVGFNGNVAAYGGGMASFFGVSRLTGCTFSGDSASTSGGGLYNNGGTTYFYGCTLDGEFATLRGGGVYNNESGTIAMSGCTLQGNSAASGGGVDNAGGTVGLTSSSVIGNSAQQGGGLYDLRGTTTLDDVVVSGNSAFDGAGVSNDYGTTELTGCTVGGNSALVRGGGVLNASGTTTLEDSQVTGNDADSSGGVASYYGATTTLDDCTISGNSAFGNGGGLGTDDSTTTLSGCTVSGNSAANGAGLYTDDNGTTKLGNCTVAGNVASGAGGGLSTTGGATVTLIGVTVSGNSAGTEGGGLYDLGGTTTLGNTIVAANSAVTAGPDVSGAVDSLGTDLIGVVNDSSGWVGSDLTGTGASPLNPLLATLGNYGGPTETMPELPGSPAINAGNNGLIPPGVTTDQRGLPRIVNGIVDIGAFESSGFTIAVVSGSNQSTAIFTSFPAPLVAVVTANNSIEPVAGGRITFTPPQSGASASLSGDPATINALGLASVGATANGTVGRYGVMAGANGVSNTATFILINQATPTITTTPSAQAITLSSSSVTLKDTAVLADGYHETGTITFQLFLGGTLLDTECVTVSGNGTYSTPNGYTLPTGSTVTGTYQWDATYTGDIFNIPAVENNAEAEQTVVSPALPVLSTTPNMTAVTLASSPVTLKDTATLSGAYAPTGTITFTLYLGGKLLDTETVAVGGDGTYATPTGYTLPTTGTVTGTYQWDASYTGDGNNLAVSENNPAAEQTVVSPASPTLSTTPNLTAVTLTSAPVTLEDTATLSGAYAPGGSITFTLYLGSTLVDTETVAVDGDGSYSTPMGYTLPVSGTVTGTYQWDACYSGDPNNKIAAESNAGAEQTIVSPASPSLSTTPNQTAITLANSTVTLKDTATITDAYAPTGTITFTLYRGSTLVDTETVAVAGDGSYTTPAGYTLPTNQTVTGTYQWDASYTGDGNNIPVSENNAAAEQSAVSPASPTLSTTPNPGAVSLTNSTVTLKDTATLSNAYAPTGKITFTLYLGGNLLDTETVTVGGDGSYTTPTGYTLPTNQTVTGTYQWDASYTGDGNNLPVSENNASAEQSAISPASPTLSTTPNFGTVTLATSTVTLKDTATLSGAYAPTGTITFTLYLGGKLLDTETAAVGGDGTYATPTGYTLPTTGTVTGTYQWDASYTGDGNNLPVSENNASAEQSVISPASPTVTTTPGPALSIGNITISGTKYLDLTGNGFSGDDAPQAGVTIDLYQVTGSTTTLAATTVTGSNGAYTFNVATPGTYEVQESVPSGYIQTGGGPDGTAGDTYYAINASAGHSYSGYNFDDYLIPDCNCTSPTFTVTTPGNVTRSSLTNLSGNTAQGDRVTATFRVPSAGTETLSLVVYSAPGSSFSDSTAYEQVITQDATGTYTTPGTYSLTVTLPNNDYQIDFVCGAAINELEPNQNNDAYGPDSANILYHAQDRCISDDNSGVTIPTLSPNPAPTLPTLTTTSRVLTDSATLSGAYYPSGTITFYLFAPGVTPNSTDSNAVYSDAVAVTGDGTYTTASGSNPGGYVPSSAGTYQWVVTYTGNPNNNQATSPLGSEPESVAQAAPSLGTTPGGSVTCGGLVKLSDSASLSGGYSPTGTITFYLFAPGVTPNSTDSNAVYSDAESVAGDGTYTTASGSNPGGYAPTATGTYEWLAVYSGDVDNVGASDTFGAEPESATAPCSVGSGQYASCGYWQGSTGQSLLCSIGNGSGSNSIGSWLAQTYPNLFGCSNTYISSYLRQCNASSLAGLTDSQIATLCTKLSTSGTNQDTYAQALACALGIYADTSAFGGSVTCQHDGFTVTWAGGSGATCNVVSNNAPFGVARNSSLSVCSVLQNLNNNFSPSSGSFYGGNQSSESAACNVLSGIVASGDVTNGLNLSAPSGGSAYTPAQIRDAYGINGLSLDGTGETIAIVDAYDDPDINEAVDAFDSEFSATDSGPSLYAQYGPASSFLTVINQAGQTSPLPSTDPSGVGVANWEMEESLDVEWTHAMAPGAQIILVEADSQSLSDLMASVGTAAAQPGVSVVSMSWGFTEGQSVFAADEANYDSVFNVPGVTFLASTGDYGAADPEYPAFSPNVVAVGGTTLNLNADGSYNSEAGWGSGTNSDGLMIGSGGGLSLYEPEPAYQEGVQSTGSRTTPDVSFDADPDTGAWIADPYNLGSDNPFEVVGGTSLAAPAWAGLIAMVDQGRAAAGEAPLNSADPTETQQALYSLPQSDYNVISSGNNGYAANPGYNLVTGLGSPVAGSLVPDLIDWAGPGTTYVGATVGPLQDATLIDSGADGGGSEDVFSVFDALSLWGGFDGLTIESPAGDADVALTTARVAENSPIATPSEPTATALVTTAPDATAIGILQPADPQTVHDAALAFWSSSQPGASKPTANRSNATSAGTLPTIQGISPGRTFALQGRLVDLVIQGNRTRMSLLGADDQA